MLKISNLSVSVENKLIINNLDLEIPEGKKVAVMGPNGSGKSTLSNVISGKPGYNIKEGSIKFEDMIFLRLILMRELLWEFSWRFNILLKFQE